MTKPQFIWQRRPASWTMSSRARMMTMIRASVCAWRRHARWPKLRPRRRGSTRSSLTRRRRRRKTAMTTKGMRTVTKGMMTALQQRCVSLSQRRLSVAEVRFRPQSDCVLAEHLLLTRTHGHGPVPQTQPPVCSRGVFPHTTCSCKSVRV